MVNLNLTEVERKNKILKFTNPILDMETLSFRGGISHKSYLVRLLLLYPNLMNI